MTYYSHIEVINTLSKIQFRNFCFTFFQAIGLSNINTVVSRENGVVTGKGTIELGIVKSYHFAFLGKQHFGTVTENIIQQIRDTMDNETDKGLVLSTGYFTREAKRQAKARGKVPIDLIDNSSIIERLKRYNLRISIETGEVIHIDKEHH